MNLRRSVTLAVLTALTACSSAAVPPTPAIVAPQSDGASRRTVPAATLYVGTTKGTIEGYDARGRIVQTIAIPTSVPLRDRGVGWITFDRHQNMYALVGGFELVKYAPPYTGKAIYSVQVADPKAACAHSVYGDGALLYVTCNALTSIFKADNGSPLGSIATRPGVETIGGIDSDSYGNLFTFAIKRNTSIALEYEPPATLANTLFSADADGAGVLFTDGATTLYAGTKEGLNVYNSTGLGIAPVYKYRITSASMRHFAAYGRYAVAGNGILFAAPFEPETGCSDAGAWTIYAYHPGETKPFESIPPPPGTYCIGGGPEILSADRSGNLFVYTGRDELHYYPLGSTTAAWSITFPKDKVASMSTVFVHAYHL
jgi:hypothetical protein